MTPPIITVDRLSKAYRIGVKDEVPDTLVSAMIGAAKAPFKKFRQLRRLNTYGHAASADGADADDTLWALKDVSFEVQEGEVLGVIGRNGAGKSTLLKILSRITEPTSGRAVLRGRISSLLEVGTGFHPELTGRENIYMNGTILGMTKREIDSKFDEIVDFSGVEKFLDTPIKRYSSGMTVRLAFAVAAHLEPEILIIDEVLAVGDMEFQKKCMGKMQDVARGGRTVLFVSHNMLAIQNLCTRVALFENGKLTSIGDCQSEVTKYLSQSASSAASVWEGNGEVKDTAISIHRVTAELTGKQPHLKLTVGITIKSRRQHEPAFVAVDIFDRSGSWVMQAVPTLTPFLEFEKDARDVTVDIDLPPIIPGDYLVGLWIGSSLMSTIVEMREIVSFTVHESPTPGRTVGHSSARGYVVPLSRIVERCKPSAGAEAMYHGELRYGQQTIAPLR